MAAAPGGVSGMTLALPLQLLGDEGIHGTHQGLPPVGQADLFLAATDDCGLYMVEEIFHKGLPRFDSRNGLAEGPAFEDAPEELLVLSIAGILK